MTEALALVLCVLVGSLLVGFVMAIVEISRLTNQLKAAGEIADMALDSEQRAEEKVAENAKIYQEIISRPFQLMLPANAIENMGNQIIRYLNNGPEDQGECPICPPKKENIN
jgi:hypothetical protein